MEKQLLKNPFKTVSDWLDRARAERAEAVAAGLPTPGARTRRFAQALVLGDVPLMAALAKRGTPLPARIEYDIPAPAGPDSDVFTGAIQETFKGGCVEFCLRTGHHPKALKFLLQSGMVDVQKDGARWLEEALLRKRPREARILAREGAKANARALRAAVVMNDMAFVHLFCQKAGADPLEKIHGETPLQAAERTGPPEMARYLRDVVELRGTFTHSAAPATERAELEAATRTALAPAPKT
jgi:hypothetical protein